MAVFVVWLCGIGSCGCVVCVVFSARRSEFHERGAFKVGGLGYIVETFIR